MFVFLFVFFLSGKNFPLEVFQVRPTGRRPLGRPRTRWSPFWPGNASGSPKRSWRVLLGRRISEFLFWTSTTRHRISGWKWMNGWMEGRTRQFLGGLITTRVGLASYGDFWISALRPVPLRRLKTDFGLIFVMLQLIYLWHFIQTRFFICRSFWNVFTERLSCDVTLWVRAD